MGVFILLFDKYLMSAYPTPGTVLNAGVHRAHILGAEDSE
jgi:hypothetical protein